MDGQRTQDPGRTKAQGPGPKDQRSGQLPSLRALDGVVPARARAAAGRRRFGEGAVNGRFTAKHRPVSTYLGNPRWFISLAILGLVALGLSGVTEQPPTIGRALPAEDEIPADEKLLVMCKVGGRSAQVVAYLVQNGYDAVNIEGGMLDWEAAGQPMVADAGDPVVF